MYRLIAASLVVVAPAAAAQDPGAALEAQKDAMQALSWMDGVWRGQGWTVGPDGKRYEVTHTERVGPFLDGSVKVMEGRGYDAAGKVGFNALAIVSWDPATRSYSLRSYAMGHAGTYVLTPNADGYVWTMQAGPSTTIRYTATFANGRWREVGERIVEGKPPTLFFETNLQRVGSSDWPAAGAIPMK